MEEDAILFFNVNKGNMNANDNEGNITIKAHGVELDSKHRNVKKIDNNDSKYNYSIDINDIQYGWTFKVKLLEKTLEKGAYLDFYANDDDLFFKSVSNIHCGRIFINQSDKCTCTVFRPAKNFKELISLVKQSEEILVSNGYENINDKISILRGIYYGTEWSLDYINEKSDARNFAFDLYTFSKVTADARKALICSSTCRGNLFESLINSFEIFDSKYKAIDFGHLIIGLDSRRSWSAINTPLNGGTGLENNTWVGDLGGGVAKLSLDRVDDPNKRAKTLFPVAGSSYGSMVNLEGDIAAYVVGMNEHNESDISDMSKTFSTIHEALYDYFDNKWDKRAYYFLKMIGGKFEYGKLTNRDEIVQNCSKILKKFCILLCSVTI